MLWVPGTNIPVVGLAARCGEMGPLYAFLQWAVFQPGVFAPLGGWRPGNESAFSLFLAVCSACVGLRIGGSFFGLAFVSR